MNANYVKRESTFSTAIGFEEILRSCKEMCAQVLNVIRVGSGSVVRLRTVDRLMLSLWLSLPFLLLVSSDWIGMVILWQGLSAAARLCQALPARLRSNGSNGRVINEGQSA